MTTPHDETEEVPEPVAIGGTVNVGHAVDIQPRAANFGSYFTYTTPAGPDVPAPPTAWPHL